MRSRAPRRSVGFAAPLIAVWLVACSSTATITGASVAGNEPGAVAGGTAVASSAPVEVAGTTDGAMREPQTRRAPDATLPPLAANGYPVVPAGDALALVGSLQVNDGGAPVPYDRKRFGPGWADPDGDGCTGRQAAIIAAARPGSLVLGRRCQVSAVSIDSLYDGMVVDAPTAGAVGQLIQVDHIVAVKDAYRELCCVTGPLAQRLRVLFYNDPENLLAVSTRSNLAKSDYTFGDARFRYASEDVACLVADRVVRVKAAYELSVETSEARALRAQLSRCPPPPTSSG